MITDKDSYLIKREGKKVKSSFNVEVYRDKGTSSTTKQTDLVYVMLNEHDSADDYIEVLAGEFQTVAGKEKYEYFDDKKIIVSKDGKNIFTGSFEEFCNKLEQ